MSGAYIQCEVFPGLFETEYYVTVNGSSAYYVDRSNVISIKGQPAQDKSVPGEVRGYVVQQTPDKTLVQLPGEPVVGGLRTWVEKTQVRLA